MIKGIIIGALATYIYLVQPEWADTIVGHAKSVWNYILDTIQNYRA